MNEKSERSIQIEILNKANAELDHAFETKNSAMVAAIAELVKSVKD
ncbi:hypothetical protein [Lacticaseibacillus daqingensis]|nr:hypothetical protein [Lacticaseibacillus daqingensis]